MPNTIAGVKIPDSKMARDLTQLIGEMSRLAPERHPEWGYGRAAYAIIPS